LAGGGDSLCPTMKTSQPPSELYSDRIIELYNRSHGGRHYL
jgi:hypothetical protein